MLSMIFFLSNIFPPPLRLGNPCFEWFAPLPLPAPCFHSLCSQWFSFYRFFLPPFLATLAFNDFLFIINFPPPFLGNPCFECFQWFSFFQIFFPFASSWQPMLWMICPPSPARALFLKPMFSMILFLWIFPPPPFLATYAFNDFLFINIFPSSWHPILSMMLFLSNFSPPPPAFLATLAFNDCVFSIFFPPPPSWQPMLSMFFFLSKFPSPPLLGNPCFQCFSFYQNFLPPLLGNPCFQWFFYQNFSPPLSWQHMLSMLSMIFFLAIFPPPLLGNPCFQWFTPPFVATHAFNEFLFIKISSPFGNPCFQWFFLKFFSPPFLATHAFNAFYDFLFIKFFSPPFFATQALNYPPSLALLATHALNHSFRIRPYSFRIRPYSFRIRRRPSSTTLYYSSSTLLRIVSESDRIVSDT